MNADKHRLNPDPNPDIALAGMALDDGLEDPDGLRTEAAERNNVAKETILHACTETTEGTDRTPGLTLSAISVVTPTSVLGGVASALDSFLRSAILA